MPENSTNALGLRNTIGPLRTQRDRLTVVANQRTIEVTAPPAEDAVTLVEAKAFMRITVSTDDARITSLITACQDAIESRIGQKLITQTLELTLDQFGDVYTPLELGPVVSVTSVTVSGELIDASRYRLANNAPGVPTARIVDDGAGLPQPVDDFADIQIVYVSGYGDESAVPQSIKDAILWFVQVAFDDPGAVMPKISRNLLQSSISIKV